MLGIFRTEALRPLAISTLLLLGLTACTAPAPAPEPEIDAVTSPTWVTGDPAGDWGEVVPTLSYLAGFSIEGREIPCERLGTGPTAVFYLAAIHGNEPAGRPLLVTLRQHLLTNPQLLEGVSVVILPIANPDGLAARRRHNLNDVDLNRNFPTENWRANSTGGAAPLSQPESRAVYDLIERHRPRVIVSLHQPLNCIDYDGPAAELAAAMAEKCALPVRKLGARPGSLGSYAGETLGIPTITVEMPRSDDGRTAEQLWQTYGEMLLVPLTWPAAR
ncbi:MAG: DUF2817 domain-containing protein [Phycisphaerales bacterium JB038]